MKVLPVGIVLCLVSAQAFAAENLSLYASLTDLNQNPAFRPKLDSHFIRFGEKCQYSMGNEVY